LQYLFKNKIAPNPFVQMLFDTDTEFAIVDVKDVADGVYSAGTRKGLHGRNYLLSSESWKVSDVTKMLNNDKPGAGAKVVYKNDAAKQDLGISFSPAQVPLAEFGS